MDRVKDTKTQVEEVVSAIGRAFPEARAVRVELVDKRGERVVLAKELLPSIEVGD